MAALPHAIYGRLRQGYGISVSATRPEDSVKCDEDGEGMYLQLSTVYIKEAGEGTFGLPSDARKQARSLPNAESSPPDGCPAYR